MKHIFLLIQKPNKVNFKRNIHKYHSILKHQNIAFISIVACI